MIRKIVDVNEYKEQFPYFIYSQLTLNTPRSFFLNTIAQGYGYLLRKVICKYPDVDSGVTQFNKDLFIEFFDNTAFQARQVAPIPLQLISTYNNNVIRNTVPAAPATYPVGKIESYAMLNFYYPYGETINIQITGQVSSNPATVDIILCGYYLPEDTSLTVGGK